MVRNSPAPAHLYFATRDWLDDVDKDGVMINAEKFVDRLERNSAAQSPREQAAA